MRFSITENIAKKSLAACFILTGLWAVPGFTSTEFQSGPNQVAVLELFTSQGCSSCPPADHWVSNLIERKGLWTEYVPLAFHVDYWDYIGWKDRFASPDNSARQRKYAEDGSVEFVYTPGFLINGEEWRQWRNVTEPPISRNDAGVLSVSIKEGETFVRFEPPSSRTKTLLATVAILGFGLESDVVAGENGGRKLLNDFVVLGTNRAPMINADGSFSTKLQTPTSDVSSSRRAVVVWVSASGAQVPLQATGGWLSDIP